MIKYNLLKKNKVGQIVSVNCVREKCGFSEPQCYDCAYISKDDIRQIFNKLYKYEQTGLIFQI